MPGNEQLQISPPPTVVAQKVRAKSEKVGMLLYQ